MIIEYLEPRVYSVQFAIDHKRAEFVRLMPGTNELSKADWERMETTPDVKAKIENGKIRIVADDSEGESLAKLSIQKAKSVVKECLDETLLLKWIETEDRKSVLEAIETQMKLIVPVMEKKNE